MTVKIEKKIVGYQVKKNQTPEPTAAAEPTTHAPVEMNETIERPDFLLGTTYKIKPPVSEHAMYITINDIILNEETDHEVRRPYEVFINSKSMEHFQWVIALTRVISSVFRKGGDVTFLVEELRSVFDPKGGYFKKGGKFMPSLVAEIGDAIESHLKMIGLLESDELDEHQKALIEKKRKEFEERTQQKVEDTGFPEGAQLCAKCQTKAMINMDGCLTCLNCGESKCG